MEAWWARRLVGETGIGSGDVGEGEVWSENEGEAGRAGLGDSEPRVLQAGWVGKVVKVGLGGAVGEGGWEWVCLSARVGEPGREMGRAGLEVGRQGLEVWWVGRAGLEVRWVGREFGRPLLGAGRWAGWAAPVYVVAVDAELAKGGYNI